MNLLKKTVLILLLCAGGTGLAGAASDAVSGDSWQASQPNLSWDGLQFAKAVKAKKQEAADSAEGISVFDDSKMFLNIHVGYDYSFLGDITNGTSQWIQGLNAGGDVASGGSNNSGIETGALIGLHLDKSNSLALDLGSVFTFGNNWTASAGGNTASQSLSPMLLNATLDYILDFVRSDSSRTYLIAGVGYYHAAISDTLVAPAGLGATGTWGGDILGGTLGLGEELSLGGSLGLDFSVKGRYASFSKVSSTTATAAGGGSGSSSLAILSTGGYNVVLPVYDSLIGPATNSRDAVVDYSGIDAQVALDIYFE